MIKSFRHKGLEAFFLTGKKSGIQAAHAPKLSRQLQRLHDSRSPADMDVPGWRLHPLSGKNPKKQDVGGHWSVWINGNWRLTFTFEGEGAVLVDYQDYH